MISLTSTYSYLWKNIFHNWCDNLLPVFSKIVLSFLLASLALIVTGSLRSSEELLSDKIRNSSINKAFLEARVDSKSIVSDELILNLSRHRNILQPTFSSDVLILNKPFVSGFSEEDTPYPIYTVLDFDKFARSFPELSNLSSQVLLCSAEHYNGEIVVRDVPIEYERVDKGAFEHLLKGGSDELLLMPFFLSKSLLSSGYSEMYVLENEDLAKLKKDVLNLEAYFSAEGIYFSSRNEFKLLAELEDFKVLQNRVRFGLLLLIIVVICSVLGTQSILEYKSEQQHYALIRSFGLPLSAILFSLLGEKIFLCAMGLVLSLLTFKVFVGQESLLDFALVMKTEDVLIVSIGIISGAILAWSLLIKISFKKVGQILS